MRPILEPAHARVRRWRMRSALVGACTHQHNIDKSHV